MLHQRTRLFKALTNISQEPAVPIFSVDAENIPVDHNISAAQRISLSTTQTYGHKNRRISLLVRIM